MKRFMLMTSLFVLFCTGGCSLHADKSSTVILQHPETMEFVNCKVGSMGNSSSYEENEQCVEDFKQQGYIVWGQL